MPSPEWVNAQDLYLRWTKDPLPDDYVKKIVALGKDFARMSKPVLRCLDVGCGNGLFSGKPYADIGYRYIAHDDPDDYVIGIDPLPMINRPPWIDEYIQTRLEDATFPDESFNTIIIATSLEHMENPENILRICHRLLKPKGCGRLYLWYSTLKEPVNDPAHVSRFTHKQIAEWLWDINYHEMKYYSEPFNTQSDTYFLKAVK